MTVSLKVTTTVTLYVPHKVHDSNFELTPWVDPNSRKTFQAQVDILYSNSDYAAVIFYFVTL